jgi:hypothetical protein
MIARILILSIMALALAGCDQKMDKATDAVARTLKDPASAQFRDVRRCGPKGEVYTGQVNSKNGYGAYGGFEHFYSDGVLTSVGFSDPGVAELQERCSAEGEGKTADEARKLAAGAEERLQKSVDTEADNVIAIAEAAVDKAEAEASADKAMGLKDRPVIKAKVEEAADQCWQDYCPCDETGTIDRTLCRDLRAGLSVPEDMFASGANLRDLRNSMRRYNAANPENAVTIVE